MTPPGGSTGEWVPGYPRGHRSGCESFSAAYRFADSRNACAAGVKGVFRYTRATRSDEVESTGSTSHPVCRAVPVHPAGSIASPTPANTNGRIEVRCATSATIFALTPVDNTSSTIARISDPR